MANKKEEKVKIDIDIKVRNIGPINKGNVSFTPLTIFVGPNSAGKTMLAHLLNIFPGSQKSWIDQLTFFFSQSMKEILSHEIKKTFLKNSRNFAQNIIKNLDNNISITLSKVETNKLFKYIFSKNENSIFKLQNFLELFKSYYSVGNLSELITYGENSGRISITVDIFNIHFNFNQAGNVKYSVSGKVKNIEFSKADIKEPKADIIEDSLLKIVYPKTMEAENILLFLIEWISNRFRKKVLLKRVYSLPAIRSGLMQVYPPLINAYIKIIPRLKLTWLEIPSLPGATIDLLSQLTSFSSKIEKGYFMNIAKEMEEEMLHGSVNLEKISEKLPPKLSFEEKNHTLNINRVSSSISEMIPFIIYLKYILKKGDILIIDEPESHLHPRNQAVLAKYLVKLVNNGLNIVITTHSDFIINKLNNLVMKEQKTESDLSLSPAKINLYLLEQTKSNFFNTKEISISDDGIKLEEFQKIREELYEEEVKLFYKKEQKRRKMQ